MNRRDLLIAAGAGTALAVAGLPLAAQAATTPVLFVAAHPDDELLAMGPHIKYHADLGQQVNVLILSQGTASTVLGELNGAGVNGWWGRQHNPVTENYVTLTTGSFGYARINESIRAVTQLGTPNVITVFSANLLDGEFDTVTAKAEILYTANLISSGPVRIKGHSYLSAVEPHPDHLAVGQALQQLSADDPVRFGDRRHYILPHAWGYGGTLPGKQTFAPADPALALGVQHAIDCFKAWAPPYSYAIGYHSVSGYFETLRANPTKCVIHT